MKVRKKTKQRKKWGSGFNSPSAGHSVWIISVNTAAPRTRYHRETEAKKVRGNKNTAPYSTDCVKMTGSILLTTHQSTGKQ